MLVLTRREGQVLRIDDSIEVHVIRVEGDRAVLGIVAPASVRVVRGELVDAVSDEVRRAAGARSQVRDLLEPRR